jgi:hypothetical protein
MITLEVLQKGGRLQIVAEVDLEGLAMLLTILRGYEDILKRLTNPPEPKP